jgi:hypothetical protein
LFYAAFLVFHPHIIQASSLDVFSLISSSFHLFTLAIRVSAHSSLYHLLHFLSHSIIGTAGCASGTTAQIASQIQR